MIETEEPPPLFISGRYTVSEHDYYKSTVCQPTPDKLEPLKTNMYGDMEIHACRACGCYRLYFNGPRDQRVFSNEREVKTFEPNIHNRVMEILRGLMTDYYRDRGETNERITAYISNNTKFA